jgi:hypothetical protein
MSHPTEAILAPKAHILCGDRSKVVAFRMPCALLGLYLRETGGTLYVVQENKYRP